MVRRRLAALLLAPLSAAPFSAVAQESPDIVVTGRGLAASPGDRTAATVTIDRDRLDANAAQRLESALADVAGLQQFRRSDSRSANPTSQGITLRGLGGNAASRGLLILDGVPQADPFGGWVAFPAYATDRLAAVRVTRGAGSGVFGPGALAGTVELESDGAGAPLSGRVAGGSRASVDTSGTAALTRSGGFATLSAAYARSDGFVPLVADRRGPADRAAPHEQASVAARAVIAAGGDTEAQVNLSAFTDRRERGTAFTANRSEGADASVRLVGRSHWRWSALAYLQTRNFASQFASLDAGRTVATQTLDQYGTPATGVGARLEVEPPVGRDLSLRLGTDIRDVSGKTQELFTFVSASPTRRREAGGAQRTAGAFADGAAELGPVTLTLGGRVDGWSIRDGRLVERALAGSAAVSDRRFADRRGVEGSGRAGAAWRPATGLSIRTAAYTGWRLPTLNELYRPFRAGADAVAANADLSPERLRGYEAGLTLTLASTLNASLTFYRNRLADAVANVTEGRGAGTFPGVGFVGAGGAYRVRRNLDAILAQGLELDAAWRPGPVGLSASWSHVSARVEASGTAAAALDGLHPAQIPRDQFSLSADVRRGLFQAAATLRHVSGQFDDDENLRRLASATTLDAYLSLPLLRRVSAELRAENLFDARVEAATSGVGAVERATPRTLWLSLRLRQAD